MNFERGEPSLRKNPDWIRFSGVENRMPNQFGGIGDNGDGMDSVFVHRTEKGEAILIPGVNCPLEEAEALAERGAIFPLEIAEPCYSPTMKQYVSEVTRSPLQGITEPLTHGMDAWKPARDLPTE